MADNSNRGFASMDDEEQRRIASEGGKAAHEKGTAHEFTSEEAREAGRKGGESRKEDQHQGSGTQGGTHEQHVEAGRKGGESRKDEAEDRGGSQGSGNQGGGNQGSGTRGGTHEQHVEAGRQSHKNDDK